MTEKELLETIKKAEKEKWTELNLTDREIKILPPEIGKLVNLEKLNLSGNKIEFLPPEIGQLTKLVSLNLGPCRRRAKTSWWSPRETTTYHVGGNNLRSLPPEIGLLTNLKELNLGYNQLDSLPPEIGGLTQLTDLFMNNNFLMVLPPEIGLLANLMILDVGDNQLVKLPLELAQLIKLEYLVVWNNPLEFPQPYVINKGTIAILEYLRELNKGALSRFEAKLLILGDGGEGKTCVSRALRGLKFQKQLRTEGVEVLPWKFENPNFPADRYREITLNIWDFEGEEINHQSHQFFLTKQSLYLLVINGRRTFKKERAEYWLDTIRARAPRSRVILVASECENTTPSWPLDKLKANYWDLLKGEGWYFAVGCENGKGVDGLAEEIKEAVAKVLSDGINWPVSYMKAEEEINEQAKTKAKVERKELYEIFKVSGISKEGFEIAAEQMHSLGLITQFVDSLELRDFVVLNPQWLTKGISKVMEDKQLENDKGEISYKRMREIWDDGYEGLYPVLHSCMKEFELCYDMEDKAGCLVPLRFGDLRLEIPWSNIPAAKERRVEYKLNVRPPSGIMSRFIVKTHYMIVKTEDIPKGVYWHNGVFLRTGEGEYMSEALCEFDNDERTLRITVRAAFPQNMIEQLHGFAKAVFSFFDGLKTERNYGCMKLEKAREEQCEGAHAERRILFALSRNNEIDCDRGWHTVDPKQLVYGFSSFGEDAVTVKELQAELAKKPKWAEELIGDIKSSLVWINKTYDEVIGIRKEQKVLPAEISQRVELKLRDYLGMLNEMLDNRDFNSAPAVVSVFPVDGSKFNPKNWFEKEYILTPYCEDEGGVHKVDFSVKFKKPREWWEKTAPKLALGVKILSAGIKIACAGLPLAIDVKIFEEIKNNVEFMKELAEHLELEGGAESDISDEVGEAVEGLKGKLTWRDLRQLGDEDEKRIARMQLAGLFAEIAPANYKARQWGPLRRVRMPDNTYRWLCEEHAEEYKK